MITISLESLSKGLILYTLPLKPLAAEAGLTILKQGGNAADAAIAVAAALNVTQPTSTGMYGLSLSFGNDFVSLKRY